MFEWYIHEHLIPKFIVGTSINENKIGVCILGYLNL